jgi:predicted aconitase with swiveling domain
MTDKERIVEVLKAYTKKNNISASSVILEEYAEELIRQGVIVAPMPMADWLREELTEHVYKRCMEEL